MRGWARMSTTMTKYCKVLWLLSLCLPLAVGGCGYVRQTRQANAMGTLKSQLLSSEPATANNAAFVLLSYETDEAYRALKNALHESSSPLTRAAVIKAFTTLHDPRIRTEMIAALGDGNVMIVELAKTYLSSVIGDSAAAELLSIARDDERRPSERVAATEVLGKIGAASSVEGLLDLLESSDRRLSDASATALREITYQPFGNDPANWRAWYKQNRRLTREQWRRAGSYFNNEIQQLTADKTQLKDQLSQSEQGRVALAKRLVDVGMELQRYQLVMDMLSDAHPLEAQVYAAEALGRAKVVQASKVLAEKSASLDPALAKACIDALGAIGDPSTADAVAKRLSAADPALKLSAVKAYASLPQSDLSRLVPLLDDPSAETRVAVAKAIGARKWAEGLSAITATVGDRAPEVRAAAAEALGLIGDKQSSGALVKVLADPDEKVRFSAVRSLSLLAAPSSFDALLGATRDPAPGVREAAVVGLGKLGESRAVERLLEMSLNDSDQKVSEQAWGQLVVVAGRERPLMLSVADRLKEAGKSSRAEELLKLLADSDSSAPEAVEARRRLGSSLLAAGNYQAARLYFQKVLDADPTDAAAFSNVAAALKGMGDGRGLAALYARQIAAGIATPEVKDDFVGVLGNLFTTGNYASVVTAADQALAANSSADKEFQSSVAEIRSKALPAYLASLVASLGDGDESIRKSARETLSGYGREAAGALVDGLTSPLEPERATALDLLTPMAGGRTFGYDAKRDPGVQQDELAQWRAWLSAPSVQ